MINKAAGQHAASAQASVRVNMISNAASLPATSALDAVIPHAPSTGCTSNADWYPSHAATCPYNSSIAAQQSTSAHAFCKNSQRLTCTVDSNEALVLVIEEFGTAKHISSYDSPDNAKNNLHHETRQRSNETVQQVAAQVVSTNQFHNKPARCCTGWQPW
jgi:hypothetical protein